MKTNVWITAIAAAAALALGPAAQAAGYLKFNGVEGEANAAGDGKHDKWIDILSIDFDDAEPGAARHAGELLVAEGDDPVAISLLLPAVQKVRAAAASSSAAGAASSATLKAATAPMKAQSMLYRETVRDQVVKTWTIRDVELSRPRATGRDGATHRIAFTYRCKDWVGADGAKGGDCAMPARLMNKSDDGSQKGNVETEFKVEKGQ